MPKYDAAMRVEKVFGFSDALIALAPEARWGMRGDEYESIEWLAPEIEKPSKEACMAKIAELQANYDANRYQRDRLYTYPDVETQLDILYHQGYDGWKASIDDIKQRFPKPV